MWESGTETQISTKVSLESSINTDYANQQSTPEI